HPLLSGLLGLALAGLELQAQLHGWLRRAHGRAPDRRVLDEHPRAFGTRFGFRLRAQHRLDLRFSVGCADDATPATTKSARNRRPAHSEARSVGPVGEV